MQAVAQPAPGWQVAPQANNFALDRAPSPQWQQDGLSESEYLRLYRLHNPRPPVPGPPIPGSAQVYGDARDYLTREQQRELMGVSGSEGSPAMQARRGPVHHASQHMPHLNGGLPAGLSGSRSNGYGPCPNPPGSRTASNVRPHVASPHPTMRAGRRAARPNHLINQAPSTSALRGRAGPSRAGTSQPAKTKKARTFSDRDSNPPTPSFKRGRLIEDITDQEEEEAQSQDMVVYPGNPSDDTTSRFFEYDLISEPGSLSFRPDMTDPATRESASLLSDPFMGSDGYENMNTAQAFPPVPAYAPSPVSVPSPTPSPTPTPAPTPADMAPPRIGIITADNVNIFGSSIMGRVAAECANGPYRNTPSAISTYHQAVMADELFYRNIWRGRFSVNGVHIIEYHNPAPRRPDVPDFLRTDRRLVMTQIQYPNQEPIWASVINGNVLIPASAAMPHTSAELDNVLDLLSYFYTRVPCRPSINQYAQLVAPLHIDRSSGSENYNRVILGMTPGSNPANRALRLATPAEEASAAAAAAVRYIPPVRYNEPPVVAPEMLAAPVAPIDFGMPPVNFGMAPVTPAAPVSPIDFGMAPVTPAAPVSPIDFGMASATSADPFPQADISMATGMAGSDPGYPVPFRDPAEASLAAAAASQPHADPSMGLDVANPPTAGLMDSDQFVDDLLAFDAELPSSAIPPFPDTQTAQDLAADPDDLFLFDLLNYAPAHAGSSQVQNAIPTPAYTAPSLPPIQDAPGRPATVPTSAAPPPHANANVNANPTSSAVDPATGPNGQTMPAASSEPFGPVSDPNAPYHFPTYNPDWHRRDLRINAWLGSDSQAPGSVMMNANNGGHVMVDGVEFDLDNRIEDASTEPVSERDFEVFTVSTDLETDEAEVEEVDGVEFKAWKKRGGDDDDDDDDE
ncbi:hypothetical protein F4859DRAFT_277879 [Xylaria cf. heliscus]|nr:hypothetical protein F4859DRAFT_277879 [Xylaria cf. heliscus]